MSFTIANRIPGFTVINPDDPILPTEFIYPNPGRVFQNQSGHAVVAMCVKYMYEDGSGLNAIDYPQIRPGDFVIVRSSGRMFEPTTLNKMAMPLPPPITLDQLRKDQINSIVAKHPGLDPSQTKVTSAIVQTGFQCLVNGKPIHQGAVVRITVVWVLFDDHAYYGPEKEGEKLKAEAQCELEFLNEVQSAPDLRLWLSECRGQARLLEQEVAAHQREYVERLNAAEDKRQVYLDMRKQNYQPKFALGRDATYWNVRRKMLRQLGMVRRPEDLPRYTQVLAQRAERMQIEKIIPIEEGQD